MRDYDEKTMEFINRVFERSDEILRQRQIQASDSSFEQSDEKPMSCERKTSKIHYISYAIPGLCAAVIGLCILSISKLSIEPNKDPDNINPTTTSYITIENKTTAISTTIVTETENNTSTISTTTTSSVTTTEPDTTSEIEDNSEPIEATEASDEPTEDTEVIPTQAATKAPTTKAVTPTTTAKPVQTKPVTTKPVVKPTLCGDVNGDGVIDIEDAVLIINYVNAKDELTWTEFCKKQKSITQDTEQALANADTFKPSDKREITSEDAEAIVGYINGENQLPTNELNND